MTSIALMSCRSLISEHGDSYECFPDRLVEFVSELGFTTVPISSYSWNVQDLNAYLKLIQPALIVLTGGEDLGVNANRDELEKALLEHAFTNPHVRVFGICRGMQMMVSSLGGELRLVPNHVARDHEIWEGEMLIGRVNSFHKFEVCQLPSDFHPVHHSSDGIIESVIHQKLPWVGWMWHPERMENPQWMVNLLRSQLGL
jgi:gamma-glutamyl-gamma-aminobutyrate hydrolase PuuD